MSSMNKAALASLNKLLHQHSNTCNYKKVIGLRTILAKKMISTSDGDSRKRQNGFIKNAVNEEYTKAIHDLNLLQSNTQAIALAKYKEPKQILPLFERQLNSAGIRVEDLDRLNIIHISGTKGKGSTCAFLESILRGEGLKTGFYNSPHLIKVTERIKLNGQQIDEQKFSKHFRYIYDRLQRASQDGDVSLPSYFSFLTILAYHIFLEEQVDCAIIEVGIGGQFDPTNIVKRPVACGITSIHFDHTNILGDTIESIAHSKAGIAKPGVPIFTVEQEHKSALDVIRRRATQDNCPLVICKPIREAVELGIKGAAQSENASLACQLGHYFVTRDRDVLHIGDREFETKLEKLPSSFGNSLASCSWPGRCQIQKYLRISFYLDGAHTKESMENCLDWFLTETFDSDVRILMVNIIGDRNKYEILKPLAEGHRFEVVIFSTNRINTSGDTPKSETFVNMQTPNSDKSTENAATNAKIWANLVEGRRDCAEVKVKSNIAEGLEDVIHRSKSTPAKDLRVLVTGSLHFVGAVLETLPKFDKVLEEL